MPKTWFITDHYARGSLAAPIDEAQRHGVDNAMEHRALDDRLEVGAHGRVQLRVGCIVDDHFLGTNVSSPGALRTAVATAVPLSAPSATSRSGSTSGASATCSSTSLGRGLFCSTARKSSVTLGSHCRRGGASAVVVASSRCQDNKRIIDRNNRTYRYIVLCIQQDAVGEVQHGSGGSSKQSSSC